MKLIARIIAIPPRQWRRIAVWTLCLLIVVNIGMCLLPKRPLARLSDAPSAVHDPAVSAVFNVLRGIRYGDSAQVEANMINGNNRLRIEWTLLNNVDVFRSATDAAVFVKDGGESTGNSRQFSLQMTTPIGIVPVHCLVERATDGHWEVAYLSPLAAVQNQSTYSSGGSSVQTLLSMKTPVLIAMQNALLARFASDSFRRQAIADAGLSGMVGPDLVGEMWAIGWSDDGLELYGAWDDTASVPELYARARMAPQMLRAALYCRAQAEAAAAVLSSKQALPVKERYSLVKELVMTGDDEATLPVLNHLSATAEDEASRLALRKLDQYLRAHPANPALIAGAWDIATSQATEPSTEHTFPTPTGS